MTDTLTALRAALTIVADGRAYTRENYPVGHPGKFVGHHPADTYDAAIDQLVNAAQALLDVAEAARRIGPKQLLTPRRRGVPHGEPS